MKKILFGGGLGLFAFFFFCIMPAKAAVPNWNVVGTYTWLVLGTYSHDIKIITQNPDGTFSGVGGYPSGSSPYSDPGQTSEIITGQVIGDNITLTTTYNGPYNQGYTVTVEGTIASDGTISGNYPWEWHTTSGKASQIIASCPTNKVPVLFDTISVPSYSSTETLSNEDLANGQAYLLVSSGTWENIGKNFADAEYASVDNWTTHMDGYDINPYFLGKGEFDLQINKNFVNWGSYNSAHEYSYLYMGDGKPVSFLVFDGDSNTGILNSGWYGDNRESLTVKIYSCSSLLPDNKDQCKKGGWESFGIFKNQGDCVSFIATKGKNLPAGN